jgi:hypothetical protein
MDKSSFEFESTFEISSIYIESSRDIRNQIVTKIHIGLTDLRFRSMENLSNVHTMSLA